MKKLLNFFTNLKQDRLQNQWDSYANQGRHDRTCLRARKGHSRSLKSADEQKIFVDKLPFLSHLAQHTFKLLARISLRDVRNLC